MRMRLCALLFTAIFVAAPVRAQQPPASPQADGEATGKGRTADPASSSQAPVTDAQAQGSDQAAGMPVSLDKIKEKLQQSAGVPPLKLDERPTFRVQIK